MTEKTNNEDYQKDMYLIFSIGREDYGISISHVNEIISIQSITEVPEYPSYIRGVINLRDMIIPVMDVRLRFGKELKEYNNRTCTIVIKVKDISIGLIVDSVSEVLKISDKDVVPPPQIGKDYHHRYIKSIGKVGANVKLLLGSEKLLNDNEIDQISQSV